MPFHPFRIKTWIPPLFHGSNRIHEGVSDAWDALYRILIYRFRNPELIQHALTHRSCLSEDSHKHASNERLEFLGDAVLGLIVTEELYRRFPQATEGMLTKVKSTVVSRERLAKIARKLHLGRFLLLGNGEDKSGGRGRDSILSDAFEAVVGAIYLDGGLEETRKFLTRIFSDDLKKAFSKGLDKNYKSQLLEYAQSKGQRTPHYRVVEESGPEHNKKFTVEVYILGKKMGAGTGGSKKRAQQEAAREAVESMGIGKAGSDG